MKKCKMDDWAITIDDGNRRLFQSQKMRLVGKVYGHPDFADGELVTSSSIQGIDDKDNPRFVTTRNTEYELLERNTTYQKWLQNFREELKKNFELFAGIGN